MAAARVVWALRERRFGAPADAVVLAPDNCDVRLVPVLTVMWMLRGNQAVGSTLRTKVTRDLFGAPDLARATAGLPLGRGGPVPRQP